MMNDEGGARIGEPEVGGLSRRHGERGESERDKAGAGSVRETGHGWGMMAEDFFVPINIGARTSFQRRGVFPNCQAMAAIGSWAAGCSTSRGRRSAMRAVRWRMPVTSMTVLPSSLSSVMAVNVR